MTEADRREAKKPRLSQVELEVPADHQGRHIYSQNYKSGCPTIWKRMRSSSQSNLGHQHQARKKRPHVYWRETGKWESMLVSFLF
jgi:hypothetical protein